MVKVVIEMRNRDAKEKALEEMNVIIKYAPV